MDESSSIPVVAESNQNWIARLFIGLLLLVPGLLLYQVAQLDPALDTFRYSQTDFDLLSEPEFVGMVNFNRLIEDRVFLEAVPFTLNILFARLVVVAVIPPLIGLLAGALGRAGRNISRLLSAVIGVLISPVVLAILAASFLSPFWGTEPSPFDSPILGSREAAPLAVIAVDAIVTLGIAAAVGSTVFMAVMRGRRNGSSISSAAVAVWLIGVFFALGSTAHTFDLPFVMTNGGPANATTTIALYFYRTAFITFRLGYASAQAMLVLLDAVIAAVLIWCVLVFFRLRLTYVPLAKTAKQSNAPAALSIPLLVLIGIPLVGLIVWSVVLAGFAVPEDVNIGQTLANTVSAPWMAIWLIQLPITYLIGLALGLVRPLGRIGSNLIFLFFLILAFIPGEALVVAWFKQAADAGALNTALIPGISSLVSAFSLIVFKLFFDGVYEKFEQARADGSLGDTFLNLVFLPSIPIVLLVGSVLSFISTQAFLWPLIAIRSRELFSFPVTLMLLRGQFAFEFNIIIGTSILFLVMIAVLFLPVFALLQILVLDRLALVAGPDTDEQEAEDTPSILEMEAS